MMQKRENNIFKRIFSNQLSYFFIGLLILSSILFPLSKKLIKQYRLNQEIKELNQEISRLEGHNKDFKEMITYLESNEFAEEEARVNLNLKKEGEEVVVIKTKDEETENLVKTLSVEKDKNTINPKNWRDYFLR